MRIFQKYYYMKLYAGNQIRQNCGYIKVESANGKTKCSFYIMNLSSQLSGVTEVFVETKTERKKLGNIFIRQGKCREICYVDVGFNDGEIEVIEIPLNDTLKIGYRLEMAGYYKKNIVISQSPSNLQDEQTENQIYDTEIITPVKITIENTMEEDKLAAEESEETESKDEATLEDSQMEVQSASEEPQNVEPYFVPDTKWEQLKKTYPNIHIFAEEAEVLLIKPQDLVVLTEKYQSLISNSFLLHGYYNYRQLLLLKWKQDENKYYVGVPGNYLDREKNVAIMFGFESFENGESSRRDGVKSSYPGNFGYYLKEVEI